MNRIAIEDAAAEAQRFQRALSAWHQKDKELEAAYKKAKAAKPEERYIYRGDANVEHAALRRSSLDLTRALARMRRPER